MSKIYKTIIKNLHLDEARSQLVLLILVPIVILMLVGAWSVYSEIKQNYLIQQRYVAHMILVEHQHRIEQALTEIDITLDDGRIEYLLQPIVTEKNVISAQWITPSKSVQVGEISKEDFDFYNYIGQRQISAQMAHMLEPITIGRHSFYVQQLKSLPKSPNVWLMIKINNEELASLQYRILFILSSTIFLSLIFLIFAMYTFAQYWLSPIYQMRIQIQRLTSENLLDYKITHSSGELLALQLDVLNLLKRLNQDFKQSELYVEETEDDLRRHLDNMEMKLAKQQHDLKSVMSLNQAKSLFLANISHELRTPLNSIDGFIQLLLRQQNLDVNQKVYFDVIHKSSAHLLALIQDILDYSKIEAGKLQLEMAWFNLEDAIYDVLSMLSPLSAQKNVQLILYYPYEVPLLVLGDELRVKQIITNLVSNAIKFTPQGEIILRVHVEKQQESNYLLKVSVQDSGIGIKEQESQTLFESFSQADISITRQYGGTGLGLAISKQLVHMMQGQIGFYDNHSNAVGDKGTTFWFTAQFKADVMPLLDTQPQNIQVLYFLQNTAVAAALRYYLDEVQVDYHEATSVFDLFSLLINQNTDKNQWLMIDYSPDMCTVLQQIRERYCGKIAVYGDYLAMDMNLLQYYQVEILAQPIYRQSLWKLFNHHNQYEESVTNKFNGQHLHILAVDDHTLNLAVLEALLQEFNIRLVKANSGQEAIHIIQQRIDSQQPLFDLIFMDLQMPVMSGFETTRAIRALESTLNLEQKMPIIALSAHILTEEMQQIRESGMNDEMVKPVQIDTLMTILQKWTRKKAFKQEELVKQVFESTEDKNILDWEMSIKLSANKVDLAYKLLTMLVDNFAKEQQEMSDLIELGDFPQLEQILHRIYGATRYVGVPKLQQITGEFEQFVSQLRKQHRIADDEFEQEVEQRFVQLKAAMQEVYIAVKNLNLNQ